jgi:hypothetical protein
LISRWPKDSSNFGPFRSSVTLNQGGKVWLQSFGVPVSQEV